MSAAGDRDPWIDALRGFAIVDMVLVHYAAWLPELARKLVLYHDVALEGFLLSAGLVTGRHFSARFRADRGPTTRRLLGRALTVLEAQWFLVLTAGLAQFLLCADGWPGARATGAWLVASLLFVNQVGLLHILPTFLPLFVLSPLLLLAAERGLTVVVVAASAALFAAGQADPAVLSYGEAPIFPVVLWQVWFVAGTLLGIAGEPLAERLLPRRRRAPACVALLAAALGLRHLAAVRSGLAALVGDAAARVDRFPPNVPGLLFGACLLGAVGLALAWLRESGRAGPALAALAAVGRHSLPVFVIHVLFAKALEIASCRGLGVPAVAWLLIAANVVAAAAYLLREERRAKRPGWV